MRAAEDDIFVASMGPSLDYLKDWDMLGNLLSRTVPSMTIVQHILFFVYPERVLLSRLPAHSRRLLRQDFSLIRLHRRRRFDYPTGGLPVTLLCAAPGMWAQLLPQLCLSEEDSAQDALCFQGHAEGFASTALSIARHGAAVWALRVAVDFSEEPATGPCANGAAALLFSLIARGDLGHLKHLTLLYSGGGTTGEGSFLSPLARRSAQPLRSLRTLRLCLADPDAHLPFITRFARDRCGFCALRTLAFFGETDGQSSSSSGEATSSSDGMTGSSFSFQRSASQQRSRLPSDRDIAALLKAIFQSHQKIMTSQAQLKVDETTGKEVKSCLPVHPLAEIDLRSTLAGPETLQVLLERLEQCQGEKWLMRQMAVKLEGTPAATKTECLELFGRVHKLLPVAVS